MLRLRRFRVKLFGGHYLPFACYYSPEKVFSKQHSRSDIKLNPEAKHLHNIRKLRQKQFRIYPNFQQAHNARTLICPFRLHGLAAASCPVAAESEVGSSRSGRREPRRADAKLGRVNACLINFDLIWNYNEWRMSNVDWRMVESLRSVLFLK